MPCRAVPCLPCYPASVNTVLVTAALIVETFEAAVLGYKKDNPTSTVDGQELPVYLPLDEDTISSGTMGSLIAGLVTASTVCAVTCTSIT